MSSKQKGFTIVEATIAVVVIAVLGFIGWTVYNNYSQSSKKTANATTSNQSGSTPSKVSETAATVTAQGTYLDMKELGVKVTLNSSISDATYNIRPSTNDGSTTANITAQSLTDKGCGSDQLGLIQETTNAPASIAGPLAVDNKTVFQINNKYYHYITPQNLGCLSGSQADTNLYTSKLQAFEQAFTTLQPDN